VTFSGSADPAHHATVAFTANPGTEYGVDVRATCGGPLVTTIPSAGGTFVVRVFRAPGRPVTCNAYTLRFAN
jgi:hypothetical protein